MRLLFDTRTFRMALARVDRCEDWIEPPFDGEMYVAFVALLDDSVERPLLDFAVEQLAASPCRYVCSWGHACSLFEELVDEIYNQRTLDDSDVKIDATFIMTTSHSDETLEDALEYFFYFTEYENFIWRNFFVLCIGQDKLREAELSSLLQSFGRNQVTAYDGAPQSYLQDRIRRLESQQREYERFKEIQ